MTWGHSWTLNIDTGSIWPTILFGVSILLSKLKLSYKDEKYAIWFQHDALLIQIFLEAGNVASQVWKYPNHWLRKITASTLIKVSISILESSTSLPAVLKQIMMHLFLTKRGKKVPKPKARNLKKRRRKKSTWKHKHLLKTSMMSLSPTKMIK